MNIMEEWRSQIEKAKIDPLEKKKLFQYAELFETNQFQKAHSHYWEMDEFLRGCVPEALVREVESEVY